MPPGLMQGGGQNYYGSDPFNFVMPRQPTLPPLPSPQEISSQPQPQGGMPVSMPVTPDQAAANPGVAPPGSTPGFGDVINRNALTLMALGGGIAQGGIGRGFSEAAKTGALEQAQNQPKLTETGTDPLTGQKTFVWAFPNQAKLVPAVSTGTAAGSGGIKTLEKFQAAVDSGVSGDALYGYLPGNAQDVVRQIVEGRMPALSLRSPAMIPYLKAAASVDPTLDMTNPGARQAAMTDARTGKVAQGQKALNQFLHHTATQLVPAFENLDNGQFPAINFLANAIHTQTGGSKVTSFLPVGHAVAEELSKVFKQNNLSDTEIKQWEKGLNPDMSPEQQRDAVRAVVGLATGGMEALHDQRLRGIGPIMDAKLGPMIDVKAQKELDGIQGWLGGGKTGSKPSAATPASGWTVTRIGQ